jgi:hypothetical protein
VVRCSLRVARIWFVYGVSDEVGRQTHLAGKVAAALKANAHLFEETPVFETADVLAAKLPAGAPRQEGNKTASR